MAKNLVLKGLAGSPGIAWGSAYLLDPFIFNIPKHKIEQTEVDSELDLFRRAIDESKRQLELAQAQLGEEENNKDIILIIETHKAILSDKVLLDEIEALIRDKHLNAAWAIQEVFDRHKKSFDKIKDEYLRERKRDLEQISSRLIQSIMGIESKPSLDVGSDQRVIVVAHDLSPADLAHLDRTKIAGIITDVGGEASHFAILARALEIPAVVGAELATQKIKHGDIVILDGFLGNVIVDPDESTLAQCKRRKARYEAHKSELLDLRKYPATTKDGYEIKLSANIEFPEEIPSMFDHGVKSIALFRSEYLLFAHGRLPTEEEHFKLYCEILRSIAPNYAIIRTLDIGSDKFAEIFGMKPEANPALGLRAIRLCLKRMEIFRTQIRALLRASAYGNLKIMFPMISTLEEVLDAKEVIEDVKRELDREGTPYSKDIKIGIMVEVPSAVATADILAKHVDFMSIGTNDLIQYALAIDRTNEQVSYLFRPLDPAILRMVKTVVDAGHSANIEVAMCGEMAGDPLYTLLLIGLGLDELSMAVPNVMKVKKVIRESTMAEAKEIAAYALTLTKASDIEKFLLEEVSRRFPEELEGHPFISVMKNFSA